MRCLYCKNPRTSVINSRKTKNETSTWRRRKCDKCKQIFTTSEEYDLSNFNVINSKAKASKFNIVILSIDIYNALKNSSNRPQEDSAYLAETVARKIFYGVEEFDYIETSQIKQITLETLKNFNQLAYLNYKAMNEI